MENDDDIMAQVFAAFCEEQAEHRATIASLLLEMEQHPDHADHRALVDRLFRAAHSLKGSARAAGLPGIEQIAHAIEDLFAALRQDRLRVTPALCDPVYAALDAIGTLVDQAIARHPPDDTLIETTIHRLRTVLDQPLPDRDVAEPGEGATPSGDETPVITTDRPVAPVGVGGSDHGSPYYSGPGHPAQRCRRTDDRSDAHKSSGTSGPASQRHIDALETHVASGSSAGCTVSGTQ